MACLCPTSVLEALFPCKSELNTCTRFRAADGSKSWNDIQRVKRVTSPVIYNSGLSQLETLGCKQVTKKKRKNALQRGKKRTKMVERQEWGREVLVQGGALCCRDALKMLLCGVGIWLPMSQIQAKTLAIRKKGLIYPPSFLSNHCAAGTIWLGCRHIFHCPIVAKLLHHLMTKKNQEIQETASNILPRFRCKRSLRRNRSIDKVRCTLYFVGRRTRKLLAQTGTSKSGFPQVSLNQTAIVASQHVIHSQNIETWKVVRNKSVGTESTARSRSLQLSLPLFSMSSLLYLTSRNYITDAVWLAAVSYNLRLANNTPKKLKAHIHTCRIVYIYIYAYIYA